MALPIDPDLDNESAGASSVVGPGRAVVQTAILIAGAGVLGALARYGIGRAWLVAHGRFPWSTFAINVSGSFVLGMLLVFLAERFPGAHRIRVFLATGFLGSYTTFSTYAVEVDLLFRDGAAARAITYAFVSLGAGGVATLTGIVAMRNLFLADRRRVATNAGSR